MKVDVTYEVLVTYRSTVILDDTEVAEWAGEGRDPRDADTLRRFLRADILQEERLIEALDAGDSVMIDNSGIIEYILKVEPL